MRATKAVIHLGNLKKNIEIVRLHLQKGSKPVLCMPVKADAYGHGAVPVAKEAVRLGIEYLAVATVDEGLELREAGIQSPILLFSQPLKEELAALARAELIPFIGDAEAASLFAARAETAMAKEAENGQKPKPRRVFLKVDTGMGRMGCSVEEAPGLAAHISGLPSIEYSGTATHLAVSDSAEPDAVEYTRLQIKRFNAALDGIRGKGVSPGIVSAANTGATVSHPEAWFDMARPGILLYGYPPDGVEPRLAMRPVMELQSAVVVIKRIKQGDSVSYGRTWTAPRDTVIGVLPLGYGDGLPRLLSGKLSVIIDGKSYPVVGRICMDQCMVDLGPEPVVERFAPVSVFGGNAAEAAGAVDAAEIARRVGAIPYEITCGITKRVPRIYEE